MAVKKNELAGIVFAIAMIALCLWGSISFHGFNQRYFEKEYLKLHTAQQLFMSEEDLFEATDVLLDYLQDEREDIVVRANVAGVEREVFNERETLHMVDVKNLWQNVQKVVAVLVGLGMFCVVYLVYQSKKMEKKELWKQLHHAFKQVTLAFIFVVAFLIAYALIDFTTFWTTFHQIFFSNDLWLLDPATSIMINMFPESFFAGMVFRIALTFVVSYGFIMAIIQYFFKKYQNS